ncbi:MAG: hypothetical protein ACR2RL_04745 [Gammaproteobacteria bacterium]
MFYESFGDEDSGIIFRDVVTLALVGIVALVVILLAHINPPGDNAQSDTTPPGNVIIEMTWANELDADVDLWVQAPGDVPVGYSNKGGKLFNLLRDDLGHSNDPSNINLETAYTRGIAQGEYIVNVHLYRKRAVSLPLEVNVVARIKSDAGSSTRNLVSRVVKLERQGTEETAFRFRLTAKGDLVADSINTILRPLRSA